MFSPDRFKGGKALVIGAGRSGTACANLLADRGFEVLLSDSRTKERLGGSVKGLDRRVKLETGGHGADALSCAFAVKSPGLPSDLPLLLELRRKRVPVFSEVETALAISGAAEVLAVTGTNGKTTTTVLLGEIMKSARRRNGGGRVLVCGNVGTPVSEAAGGAGPKDVIVMELSSYQLEDSSFIAPKAACVLNVTPDHLDRHGAMSGYIRAKAGIFGSQTGTDACVFNADDGVCRSMAGACPSRKLFFSSSKKGGRLDAWVEERGREQKAQRHKGVNGRKRIILKWKGKRTELAPPALPGRHNLENAMCAALMASARGAAPAEIQKAFSSFKGVEHRIERVRKTGGVVFINDSKATNVDSALVALKALDEGRRNIWLILGGLDKGSPYAPLLPYLKRSVKAVLAIGTAAPKIAGELAGGAKVLCSGTLSGALKEAVSGAEKGDIVLLSPACASFDQFRDYEDRGRRFKTLVRKIRTGGQKRGK